MDPLKIRFIKSYDPIDQTSNCALLDIIRKPKVYYVLDGDIIKSEKSGNTEKEKFFKIIWLGNNIKNEVCEYMYVGIMYLNFESKTFE
jgi:hypothetical protein